MRQKIEENLSLGTQRGRKNEGSDFLRHAIFYTFYMQPFCTSQKKSPLLYTSFIAGFPVNSLYNRTQTCFVYTWYPQRKILSHFISKAGCTTSSRSLVLFLFFDRLLFKMVNFIFRSRDVWFLMGKVLVGQKVDYIRLPKRGWAHTKPTYIY